MEKSKVELDLTSVINWVIADIGKMANDFLGLGQLLFFFSLFISLFQEVR